MCEKCTEAVKEIYPNMPKDEMGELLMECTCFPMGSTELVRKHLLQTRISTDGTLWGAIDFAHNCMDAEWKKYKAKQANA